MSNHTTLKAHAYPLTQAVALLPFPRADNAASRQPNPIVAHRSSFACHPRLDEMRTDGWQIMAIQQAQPAHESPSPLWSTPVFILRPYLLSSMSPSFLVHPSSLPPTSSLLFSVRL